MKTVSNEFKQEIIKLGRQYKNKINIYGDGHLATQDNRLILTQDNMMLIVENSVNKVLEDDVLFNINLSRKGKILSTMMKELDFESYEDINVGNVIEYLFGLKIGDIYEISSDGTYKANTDYYELEDDKYILMIQDEDYVVGETIVGNIYNRRDNYEWVNFNKFIVYSKEYNEDTKTYSYVCYDYMLKTMIPINNTITIQNTKIKNAIKNIADNFGLMTTLDTTEYPNLNKVINSNAFNNVEATYRDVLDMICQAIGTTMIASDDNLILKSLNTSPVCTLDSTYLKDTNVSFGKKYGPINSLVLSRSGQTDNIYRQDTQSIEQNGLTEFKINDNLILLYNDREQYIDNIFNKLDGVEYYINDFSSTGIGFIEFLDFYNITIDDNTYKCLMLNSDFKVKNGISEEISTEEPEETNTDYTTSGKTDKDVSFIVDKQTASINAKVSKGEVINEINLDSTGASINANKISLAGKTIQLTSDDIAINSTKFQVDKNGNVECSNMKITGGTLEIGNKFEVDKYGNVECSSIDITGGTLNINDKFDVDQYGNVECSSIDITGGTIDIYNSRNIDIITITNPRNGEKTTSLSGDKLEIISSNNLYSELTHTGLNLIDGNYQGFCSADQIMLKHGNDITYVMPDEITTDRIECDSLYVSGTKNRVVDIGDKKVLMNAYETPTPYFADIGSNETDSNGYCKIEIEEIFAKTIENDDYKVFIQECGEGKLYIEKHETYFEVKGTPNLKFDWEIKAIQKGFKNVRMEEFKEKRRINNE